MAFMITCDNKGCFETTEAQYDVVNDEALCAKCGKAIHSVTSFAKNTLKSLGQTIKNADTRSKAFAVMCNHCSRTDTPYVEDDGKLHCQSCKKHLDKLSAQFAYTVKQMLGSNGNS